MPELEFKTYTYEIIWHWINENPLWSETGVYSGSSVKDALESFSDSFFDDELSDVIITSVREVVPHPPVDWQEAWKELTSKKE